MNVKTRLYKKSQGLSLQAVVIAFIVIVVLVVMIAVFTGGIENIMPWLKSTTSCSGQGGDCVLTEEECTIDGGAAFHKSGCPEEGQAQNLEWCCIKEKK